MKIRYALIAAATVSLLALAGCSGASGSGGSATPTASSVAVDSKAVALLPKDIQKSKVVNGGGPFDTAPLYFYDISGGDKKESGLLIDLIDNAAKHLGITVNWTQLPYASIIPGMNAGKVDVAGGQFSSTTANLAAANLVSIYRNTVAFVIPADKKSKYKTLTDICGTNIAVARGSTIEQPAIDTVNKKCDAAGKPEATVTLYDGSASVLTAVKAGRADSYILSEVSAVYQATTDSASFATAFGGEFQNYNSGFAINKTEPEVAAAFTAAFNDSIKDGSYAKIMKKYNVPDNLHIKTALLNAPVAQ
jgi:polar amino acid transport system substrate-binding protein